MRQIKAMLKRIIVIAMILITLMFFVIKPSVEAAKLPKDGEFYYSGTTEGTYVVSQGVFAWLLDTLKGVADFIMGIMTMGFRMVFVGWTALLEIWLTDILEATMGVKMSVADVDATDLSESTGSKDNVTIEAIVYNLVPAFNINLFRSSAEEIVRTGTGRELTDYVCENCEKDINSCTCSEAVCDCNLCQIRRFNADPNNKNVVDIVKESVTEWYYIIRLIAIIGMLLVLLGIGIRLAISTVASEKALYKRMLVDWIVGFIIIFTAHYMMIAIININEVLVDTIKNSANSAGNNVVEVTQKQFNKKEKTNEDLEISIYEATRTRAYDAKLINGMTGMVMYATLVYFAFKFSLIYLKRYLTIIALTLMAPGAGFAYAIQKALSGKSKAFGNWLKEYIMNVIIQTVHALLYSSFVSMALVISLDSISGMIIAFILINFMSKADKLFRKIFKMSSEGSLLDNAENSGDPSKLMSNLKTAQGLYMAAKPVTKALLHSPITKAVTGTLRAARNEAVLGISNVKNAIETSESAPAEAIRTAGNFLANAGQGAANFISKGADTKIPVIRALGKAFRRAGLDSSQDSAIKENKKKVIDGKAREAELLKAALTESVKHQGIKADMERIKKEIHENKKDKKRQEELKEEYREKEIEEKQQQTIAKEAWGSYNTQKNQNYRVTRLEGLTITGVAKAHVGKLFDVNNYYRTAYDSKGKAHRVRIGSSFGTRDKNGNIRDGLLSRRSGTFFWDKKSGKPKYMSVGDLISNQLSSKELLGLSKEDKKTIKDVSKFIGSGLVGMASMTIGLGTFVSNPKIGLPLLASGTAMSSKLLGKNLRRSKYGTTKPQVYSFNKFSAKSQETIINELYAELEDEKRSIYSATNDAALLGKNIDNSGNRVSDIDFAGVEAMYNKLTADNPGVFRNTIGDRFFGGITGQLDIIADEQYKELIRKEKEQKQVGVAIISDSLQQDYMKKMEELEKMLEESEQSERTEEQIIEDSGINKIKLDEDTALSFEKPVAEGEVSEVKAIDTIIEHSILQFAVSKKQLDITKVDIDNKAAQEQIKKDVENKLKTAGVIKADQKLESVIVDINERIRNTKAVLDKEAKENTEASVNIDIPDGTSKESSGEVKISKVEEIVLQNTIKEYIKNKKISKIKDIDQEEVMELYKTALAKMKVEGQGVDIPGEESEDDKIQTEQQVKSVLESLHVRKEASIKNVKKLLTDVAKSREKIEVQKLGAKKDEKTGEVERVEVKYKDKDAKYYREDVLIEQLKKSLEKGKTGRRNGNEDKSPMFGGKVNIEETSEVKPVVTEEVTEQKQTMHGMKLDEKQSEKVLELLLLQRKMKKMNQEALKLKMAPIRDTAHERARKANLKTLQMTGGSLVADPSKKGDRVYTKNITRKPSDMTYGPVNDIVNIINSRYK